MQPQDDSKWLTIGEPVKGQFDTSPAKSETSQAIWTHFALHVWVPDCVDSKIFANHLKEIGFGQPFREKSIKIKAYPDNRKKAYVEFDNYDILCHFQRRLLKSTIKGTPLTVEIHTDMVALEQNRIRYTYGTRFTKNSLKPEAVKKLFEAHGRVIHVKLKTEKGGKPSGFCFVSFANKQGLQKCLEESAFKDQIVYEPIVRLDLQNLKG